MSDSEEKPGSSDYEVGYGKPPKERRFKKGTSGNPRGRPRRKIALNLASAADQPTLGIVLQEAYRKVSVREGDNVLKMPAMQAVVRSIGVAAMKGNRFAQRMLTETVQKIESQQAELRFENFKNAVEYKDFWEKEFARCDAQGISRPEAIPHPDDVLIDPRMKEVRIEGPVTADEKAEWDRILKYLDSIQAEFDLFAADAKKSKKRSKSSDAEREYLIGLQDGFDRINNMLPKRYRRTLNNRLRVLA
jgi:Family of unknown function (DUF5681)